MTTRFVGNAFADIAYAQPMAIRPERKWNSAIDLENWIDEQSSTDQVILEKRYEGYALNRIATDLCLSNRFVRKRCRKLGFELAARTGIRIQHRRANGINSN